jgi:general secretion pathway protein F
MPQIEPPLKIQPKWSSYRDMEAAIQRPAPPATNPQPHRSSLGRISTKELCRLTRQLAALLHAGMPLVPALTALAEQLQSPTKSGTPGQGKRPLAAVMEEVRDEVNEGGSLAQALQRHPHLFSPLFISMVSAGESSGALEEVLARVADILQQRAELTDKVKAALAYPALMAFVAAGVVTFLLSYVVPSLTKLFVEMNRPLPVPTRLLIAVSDLTRGYLVVIVGVLCALVLGLVALSRSTAGKARLNRLVLRLPLFGPLLFRLELARLTRTLGALMQSGLPVLTAMEITERVVQNTLIAQALRDIREAVHKGDAIADAVRTTGLFPPVVYHLLATGQLSGTIEESLLEIATMYDGEVQSSVRTLTALLEPVILLVMGAVVAFIVLAILLPVFEINQAL